MPFSAIVQARVFAVFLASLLSGCSLPLWKYPPAGSSDAGSATDGGTTCTPDRRVCFADPVQTSASWGLTSVTGKQGSLEKGYSSIVVAAYGSSEVIELRTETALFETVNQLTVDQPPWQAVVGDFELNGADDLLVASPGSTGQLGTLSLWRNPSGKHWSSAMTETIGAGTYAMAARATPLAQHVVAVAASYDAQTLLPFLARSGSAPTVGKSTTVDLKPTAVSFTPDIGNSNQLFVVGSHAGSGRLRVFDVSGDSLSSIGRSEDFGISPNDVKLGDLNGDSRLDAVVIDDCDESALYSLAEDASGAWQVMAKLALPAHSHAVALDDLDRDGHLDVAVISGSTDTVEVCFGNGSGGFGNCIQAPHALLQPTDIIALDIDADGWTDLVAVGYEGRISSIRLIPSER